MTLQLQSAISPIPGYELQERIGTGGYGEVWRSTAPGGLLKAVKFVFGYMDDERATRELKALQRIREVRHPFLLSLERIEVVEGQLVIVTELADGSLKDRFVQCRQQGLPGIPRDELLEHLRDAAAALDFMSERHSLQHLDVKPENLLLVGGRVKVADFGLVKDLIDGSISLMGSMTPIYAPPEVFDGRPSRASDQYSLAIVYQEMLTGSLPFPGKTLAQLAAQHLSSRPRLAALPTADHAAVALALAKDPAARHANCRALIEALFSAGQASPQGAAIESVAASPQSFAKVETKTNGKSPTHAAPQSPSKRSATPGPAAPGAAAPAYKTVVLGSEPGRLEPRPSSGSMDGSGPTDTAAGGLADDECAAIEAPAEDDNLPTTVSWLPPVETTATDTALRPVLFIGLGGLAGRALQQLRGRLAERFGDLDEMPAVQLLLLDTDVRALTQASSGKAGSSLATSQTMALPLRKTLDYRGDSRKLLRWLSRRWLYNIPRSLQTEGLRPLGRLALVDHVEQVHKRLRAALAAAVAPDSLATSALHADRPFAGPPRVFVVSSISGGAGSGMVLDVAYAVRQSAAELGLNVDDLCGLLAHVTSRDVDAQALAVANAHSFLQELNHYSHPQGGYPGDPACGLPASPPGVPPFAHTYVMHLGDDLVDGQFDAAADTLAEYLYRASVTPAASMLDACRRPRANANDDGQTSAAGVRSFGLCPLGVSPGNLGQTTEVLCRQVVEGWRGADATTIDARAAKQADERGLGLDATARTIQALIAKGLGGDAAAYIHRTVVGYQARTASRDAHESSGGPLAGMNKALGLLDVDEAPRQSLGAVEAGLPKLLQELTITRLDGLRTWLLERVSDPEAGLTAAQRAADWFVQHFRAIEKRAGEQRAKLTEELKDLERGLQNAAPPERSKARAWLGLGAAVRPGSEQEQWMTRYAQARLDGIVWQGVSGHARGCAAQAGAIAAQLKDLGRDLALVATQFNPANDAPKAHVRSDGDGVDATHVDGQDDSARASLAAMLRKQMAGLAARMDAELRREFLSVEGCLLDLLCRRVDLRGTLPPRLRAAARGVVLDALQQIDVADVLFPASRGDSTSDESAGEPLRAALRRATPDWLETGGARRLMMFLPEGTSVDRLQVLLEREAGARASVSRDAGGDLLLGCEVEGLSIPRIAASLVTDRPDCREAAARLHARIDVVWRKSRAWR